MPSSSWSVRLTVAGLLVAVGCVAAALMTSGAPPAWRPTPVAAEHGAFGIAPVLDLADPLPAADSPGACAGDAYAVDGWRLSSAWSYRVGPGVEALGLTPADLVDLMDHAARAWSTEPGRCAIAGTATLVRHLGPSAAASLFTTGPDGRTRCPQADGVSVLDVGPLSGDLVGIACTRWQVVGRDHVVVEADIRLDSDHRWTRDPHDPHDHCDGAYDVRSVLTHELGHVLGLDDLSGREARGLTMLEDIPPCTTYARTPGRGDLLGLQSTVQAARGQAGARR